MLVEIKQGNKTIYKESSSQEQEDWHQGDITTSLRKGLSMGDIPQENWERIFGKKENAKDRGQKTDI
jgi:hypothetical protein